MPTAIALPIKETNLLRQRLQRMLELREAYLRDPREETIHDLRVSSRRAREILDYLKPLLQEKWYARLSGLGKSITKQLGKLRETEVNLDLVSKWQEEKRIDSVVAELLIFEFRNQFDRLDRKARNKIDSPGFLQIRRFLARLHGSRLMMGTGSGLLEERNREFLAFSWDGVMDDLRLHDLRIRTKKFRYAMEIYDRLHARNLGRFTRRVRSLQDVLGRIHDLYVLSDLIATERIKWSASGTSMIPELLSRTYDSVIIEKNKLYPRVLPIYTRILETSPLLHVGAPVATAV